MAASNLEQLTALDALFLTQEAPDTPMHIGLLMFYTAPENTSGPLRFKSILARFRERAQCAPIFHHTVGKVPLGIDYPFWLDAQDLDVEFHVRHIALPKPGDWRQLCIQVARLQARVLDKTRPLWEAYVIGIMNSMGLFHAVMSCNGRVSIAINACREMLPDPGFYAECIDASYAELRDATLGRR